ncbi:AbrB/MazE/SpoVT family DNA-binding domain-containing protein [Variovorax sp. DT-64]|uniref:AbrB/MazE/SpoVT family DNA-binding domain-containing protein n=1 Tax=Variovorax sp. DT-64 TaxID=3396160 RepID=UPI003F1BED42
MQTTLTSKGQMTLPSAARARLGLEAGDRLLVTVVDENTIVLKRPPATPAKNLRGLLARPGRALSVEEMDAGVAEHLREKQRSGTRK